MHQSASKDAMYEFIVPTRHVTEPTDRELFGPAKELGRRVSLWRIDAWLLVLDYLQMYSLLLSLVVEWGVWPLKWTEGTAWVHLFALDFWALARHYGPYERGSGAFVRSDDVGITFQAYFWCWSLVLLLSLGCYFAYEWRTRTHAPFNYHTNMAKLHRGLFTAGYVLFIPYGIVFGRAFQCTEQAVSDQGVLLSATRLYAANEISCWGGEHFAYVAVGLVGALFLLAFIVYTYRSVNGQVFSSQGRRHEGYLQLKEAEYALNVDRIWLFRRFYVFSSFHRYASYYRIWYLVFKFALLVWFASLFQTQNIQALMMFLSVLVLSAMLFWRPVFRVHLCDIASRSLATAMLLTTLLAFLKVQKTTNSLLETPYLETQLGLINGLAFTVALICFIAMELRSRSICFKGSVWPVLAQRSSDLSDTSRTYLREIMLARRLLDRTRRGAAMLAPTPELSRHIQIVNSLCREAEAEQDPARETLWDLLDELISAHNASSQHSLFAATNKTCSAATAEGLLDLLPALKTRLDRRHFDLVLMSRKKQRILLKLLAVAAFLPRRRHQSYSQPPITSPTDGLSNPRRLLNYSQHMTVTAPS